MIRRQPSRRLPSVASKYQSSFIDSKSKRSEPVSPLISIELAFWRPVASRVASKLAVAPPAKLARKSTASSTSLLPFLGGPLAPTDSGRMRSVMNVREIAPCTSVISSPTRKRAMSTRCAFKSPCAPEPALFFWKRHKSGVCGPPQSCRYVARTW